MSFEFSVVHSEEATTNASAVATIARNEANPTIIKVIGCGGGGSSAIKRMIEANVQGVEFSVINTDLQALNKSPAPKKVPIGTKLTGGLGAGGNPEVGENAAKEDSKLIEEIVKDADMVILTAGMGGGTGTGSIPVIADLAKKAGALTVAVVTTPYEFEGSGRMKNAQDGLEKLRVSVDSLIVIPNEQIFKIIDRKINFREAFQIADQLLCEGVQGISEIITQPGDVNLDFNDVKSVMKGQGDALLGVGYGEGENRGIDAAQMAISNPMLENLKMDGASKILINITGSDDLGLTEVQEIVKTITASANPENDIFWGQVFDPSMDDKVRVTVIATGFEKIDTIVAPEEKQETVSTTVKKDDSVVGSHEFDSILHPTTSFAQKKNKSADPFFVSEVAEKKEEVTKRAETIFKKEDLGDFEPVHATYRQSQSQFTPPPNLNLNRNDYSQPAVWRNNTANYGRGISLSDD